MATKLETQIAMMQDELELNRRSVTFTEALADQYRKRRSCRLISRTWRL